MFNKAIFWAIIFGVSLIFAGCSNTKNTLDSIEGKLQVAVIDRMQNPIKDAQVIFVSNNKYIGKAVTDVQGKTSEILLNAQLDPLVKEIMDKDLQRGVVNIIVSKDGYRDVVVFESWVYENAISTQIVKLNSIVQGERNEPEYYVIEPHRLEVIRYVEYYKRDKN